MSFIPKSFVLVRSLALACLLGAVTGVAAAEGLEFELTPEQGTLADCPIELKLPGDYAESTGELSVTDLESGRSTPVQRGAGAKGSFILQTPIQAGESRRFRLSQTPAETRTDRLASSELKDGLVTIRIGDRPVLSYHVDVSMPPEDVTPLLKRSGHLHPVFTPEGRITTDEFPVDHLHQHGVFSAWVSTRIDGRRVDFWNQRKGEGTVEHRKLLGLFSGPVAAGFQAELAHVDLKAPDGPVDALSDHWSLTVYSVADGHLFEIETLQQCATETPVVLPEHMYGGMALRGAHGWGGQPAHNFLTSEGLDRVEGNASRPNWVAMFGEVDGVLCTMSGISHPDNVHSPQSVRLHPEMPYFVFAPVMTGGLEITPDQPYHGKYRFFVNDGGPNPERLNALWQAFATPPQVKWIESGK